VPIPSEKLNLRSEVIVARQNERAERKMETAEERAQLRKENAEREAQRIADAEARKIAIKEARDAEAAARKAARIERYLSDKNPTVADVNAFIVRQDRQWERTFSKLTKWVETHSRAPKSNAAEQTERALASWVKYQTTNRDKVADENLIGRVNVVIAPFEN
jgi:hypothetical protein